MAGKFLGDPTRRFNNLSENYRKYRPSYPEALYVYLTEHAGLAPRDVIADIGSGTGLLSQLFLRFGHVVYGIEPNAEMRKAAELTLAGQQTFHNIDGRAEAIPVADSSVDFVVVGQAFHWFDAPVAKREINRILKPGKQVALIWNNRSIESNDFHRDYEALLQRFGTDYAPVSRRWKITDVGLAAWFFPNPMSQVSFPNSKRLDGAGLRGVLLSASYMPMEGDPNHEPMLGAIDELFNKYQSSGVVRFEYKTMVYHGRV